MAKRGRKMRRMTNLTTLGGLFSKVTTSIRKRGRETLLARMAGSSTNLATEEGRVRNMMATFSITEVYGARWAKRETATFSMKMETGKD